MVEPDQVPWLTGDLMIDIYQLGFTLVVGAGLNWPQYHKHIHQWYHRKGEIFLYYFMFNSKRDKNPKVEQSLWLVACPVPSKYLNLLWWLIANWTCGNKFQWNLNHNPTFFSQICIVSAKLAQCIQFPMETLLFSKTDHYTHLNSLRLSDEYMHQ